MALLLMLVCVCVCLLCWVLVMVAVVVVVVVLMVAAVLVFATWMLVLVVLLWWFFWLLVCLSLVVHVLVLCVLVVLSDMCAMVHVLLLHVGAADNCPDVGFFRVLTVVVPLRSEVVVSWRKNARSPHFVVDSHHYHDLHQALESLRVWHAPNGSGNHRVALGCLPQCGLMCHVGVSLFAFVAETKGIFHFPTRWRNDDHRRLCGSQSSIDSGCDRPHDTSNEGLHETCGALASLAVRVHPRGPPFAVQ